MTDRPLKAAIVLPDFAAGGAQRVVLQLAARLDPARIAAELVVLDATGPLAHLAPPHLPLHDLSCRRMRSALPALRRVLRATRPRAVLSTIGYVNMGTILAAGDMSRCRIVLREANMPDATQCDLGWLAARLGYGVLYRRAHAVVANSRRVAAGLAGAGVPERRIEVIPNLVDARALGAAALSGQPAVRPAAGAPLFVASGRLREQKGFDRLLDWFATVPPPAELALLGAGPMEADLKARATAPDLAGRVRLTGYVDNPAPTVASSRAFLLPSRWEGMANAALEALALGVPVIAHQDAGGIGELAAECAPGAVTVVDDGPGFAAAIRQLADAPPPPQTRASLLPVPYAENGVIARYSALLEGAAPRGLQ